jgi:type VI secretion system protein ImpB
MSRSGRDGSQKKLQKVRPPRVQLTYDVEVGDAVEQKEIPFVVGVLGDYGSNPDAVQQKLKDKKFVNIDVDNFSEVMGAISPQVTCRVPNKLSPTGGEFAVDLKFQSMDDFRPESIVQQVEPLRKLLEARTRLADLRNKLAGNDKLEDLLGEVLSNTEQLNKLSKEAQPKDQE